MSSEDEISEIASSEEDDAASVEGLISSEDDNLDEEAMSSEYEDDDAEDLMEYENDGLDSLGSLSNLAGLAGLSGLRGLSGLSGLEGLARLDGLFAMSSGNIVVYDNEFSPEQVFADQGVNYEAMSPEPEFENEIKETFVPQKRDELVDDVKETIASEKLNEDNDKEAMAPGRLIEDNVNETMAPERLNEDEVKETMAPDSIMESKDENKEILTSHIDPAPHNISSEIWVKDRLIQTYKNEIEHLKLKLETMKNDESQLRSTLEDKDAALKALYQETKKISNDAKNQVEEREMQILTLQDELDKANDLLKFGNFALPNGDMSSSSFSANATLAYELLSSGTSLTSIYAQYSKVVAELTEERQMRKQLDEYVRSLVEDLKKNAPNIIQIRKDYDSAIAQNEELCRQLKAALDDLDYLRNEYDTIGSKHKSTSDLLDSAQHQNSILKKQVQKLLFVADQSGTNGHDVSKNDITVFSNIREMHEKNIDLLEKLEEMKRSNDESLERVRHEELDNLHQQLSKFQHEIEVLRDSQEKTALIIDQLEKERDGYKAEVVHLQQTLNISREMEIDNEWKKKYERLHYILEDKQKSVEDLNSRIDSQSELINQLRSTNTKMESVLDFHKKNQETAFKKVNDYEKEISKKNEQIAELKAQQALLNSKVKELQDDRMDSQNVLLNELRLTNIRMENVLENHQEKQEMATMKLNELQDEMCLKNELIEELTACQQDASNKMNELHGEISRRDEQIVELKTLLEAALKKVTDLEQEIPQKDEKIAQLKAHQVMAFKKVNDLGKENTQKNDLIAELKASTTLAKVNELEKELSKKDEELKELMAFHEIASKKMYNFEKEISEKNEQMAELKAGKEAASEKINALEKEISEKDEQLVELKAYQETISTTVNELEKEIFEKNEQIAALKGHQAVASTKTNELEKNISEKDEQLNELNMRLTTITNLYMKQKTEKHDDELKQLNAEQSQLMEENKTVASQGVPQSNDVAISQSVPNVSKTVAVTRKRPVQEVIKEDADFESSSEVKRRCCDEDQSQPESADDDKVHPESMDEGQAQPKCVDEDQAQQESTPGLSEE